MIYFGAKFSSLGYVATKIWSILGTPKFLRIVLFVVIWNHAYLHWSKLINEHITVYASSESKIYHTNFLIL